MGQSKPFAAPKPPATPSRAEDLQITHYRGIGISAVAGAKAAMRGAERKTTATREDLAVLKFDSIA